MVRLSRGLVVAVVLIAGIETRAAADEAAWAALQAGGVYAVVRHALAPGTGDPEHFALGDCTTQRNLNADGRAQARRLGDAFRARGIRVAAVFSSQWCRCLETARLLDLGPVTELPPLNSFFEHPERRSPQMAELGDWFAERGTPEGAVILVTHQVNVTALTGVYPTSGELVVFRAGPGGEIAVIGRIPPT